MSNESQYLFVLSPNFCGSTLLCKILSSSSSVSFVNSEGTFESQKLEEFDVLIPKRRRWDDSFSPDWSLLKQRMRKRWNLSKPILADKSPPYIMRLQGLLDHFKPSMFILLVRDPYAYAESLIRRPGRSPEEAARIVVKRMSYQRENLQILKSEPHIFLKYEELTDDPENTIRRMQEFTPHLEDLRITDEYDVHNLLNAPKMAITNLNEVKISRLNDGTIKTLNDTFGQNEDVLEYFGYKLMSR